MLLDGAIDETTITRDLTHYHMLMMAVMIDIIVNVTVIITV